METMQLLPPPQRVLADTLTVHAGGLARDVARNLIPEINETARGLIPAEIAPPPESELPE